LAASQAVGHNDDNNPNLNLRRRRKLKVRQLTTPCKFVQRGILLLLMLAMFSWTNAVSGQTTSFTYQGALSDGGTMANGNYDLKFSLWDSLSGGTQIGATQSLNVVLVSNGIFSVTLDFGASAFFGPSRFLELSTRPAGVGEFTLLSPRQEITSTPFAIRSVKAGSADTATNAAQLGGVPALQYVQTNDSRLTDSRSPTAGSGNYIQNGSGVPQSANFNISGNGAAAGTLSGNIVDATTQYRINGVKVMSTLGLGNLFVGANAGAANSGGFNTFVGSDAGPANTASGNSFFGSSTGKANTLGSDNAMFGSSAGAANTAGSKNSFFGSLAGASNKSGDLNSFFGSESGFSNTGDLNSFFGSLAGQMNTTGSVNTFIGVGAGQNSISGQENSFVGYSAGKNTAVGSLNVFFGSAAGELNESGGGNVYVGAYAGKSNKTGKSNTFVGAYSGKTGVSGDYNTALGYDASSYDLSNATAIGAFSKVTQDNSMVLGSILGVNAAAHDTNVGIGTTAPAFRFTVRTATNNYGMVHTDGNISLGTYLGGSGNGGYIGTKSNHPLHFFVNDGAPSMTVDTGGVVHINALGSAGSTALCRNASNQISTCSSSLRYKKDLQPFNRGLALLNSLHPITFKWKADNSLDLGFGAEDVAAVEPLLVTHNDRGEVEGVKYDRITAVLVNAVKEQQTLIASQQFQLNLMHQELVRLRQLITQPRARLRHR